MARSLVYTSFLVPDCEEALVFFTQVLRWRVREDVRLSDSKRWLVVAPGEDEGGGGALLLARASTPEQRSLIGRQGGGRVGWFLHTDQFETDRAHMLAHGVRFAEAPRQEAYGRVAVFLDPWGNRWDLIQPNPEPTP